MSFEVLTYEKDGVIFEYQVLAECLLFQNSFRLGGRMMLEVMRSATGNE